MDKDKDFYDKYIDKNPDACEVMVMADELAKHIEETFKYNRKTICEGLFVAALDMAIGRLDDDNFQPPEITRAFYDWAENFLKNKKEEFFTEEEQNRYEEINGKHKHPVSFYRSDIAVPDSEKH